MDTTTNHLKIPKPRNNSAEDAHTQVPKIISPLATPNANTKTVTNALVKNKKCEYGGNDSSDLNSTLNGNTPFKCLQKDITRESPIRPLNLNITNQGQSIDISQVKNQKIQKLETSIAQETTYIKKNAYIFPDEEFRETDYLAENLSVTFHDLNKDIDNLFSILCNIFTSKQDFKNKDLSLPGFCILNAILFKKFSKYLNIDDMRLSFQSIENKLQSIIPFSASKRPEECYKYILSKVKKHLKTRFKCQFKVKKIQWNKFYDYYFGETARKNNIPLESFYFPNKSKKLAKNSLNSSFFSLIFKSANFTNALKTYIDRELVRDHKKDVYKKLNKFIDKLQTLLVDCKSLNWLDARSLSNEIFKSAQLILPWTLFEVQEAALRVNELIEDYK